MSGNFFGGQFFGGGFFGAIAPATTLPAGTGGRAARRRQELWSVTVDGKPYVFDSLDALISFLNRKEEKEEAKAEVKAERDAQRIVSIGASKVKSSPPKISITSPTQEIRDYAADVQAKIDRVYWRALSVALAREAEEDEDIQAIARIDFD